MTADDVERVRDQLEEVAADLRTVDSALVEPLSLERAVEHVEETRAAYVRLEDEGQNE